MPNQFASKLTAEFIGTFAFIFIGAGAAAVIGAGTGLHGIAAIALAHGLTIMVFAFAYGSISGGHFNPAVTVGVLAAGEISIGEAVGYIISQIVGAVAGALLLKTVLGGAATGLGVPALAHDLSLGATTLTITPIAGFAIEAVLAFFLVTTVLNTAVAGRAGILAPFAIGMTVTLNILMGGALTGAAFNPARALGPMIATGNLGNAWLYVAAPLVGAGVAAFGYTALLRVAEGGMTPSRSVSKPTRDRRQKPTSCWSFRNTLEGDGGHRCLLPRLRAGDAHWFLSADDAVRSWKPAKSKRPGKAFNSGHG